MEMSRAKQAVLCGFLFLPVFVLLCKIAVFAKDYYVLSTRRIFITEDQEELMDRFVADIEENSEMGTVESIRYICDTFNAEFFPLEPRYETYGATNNPYRFLEQKGGDLNGALNLLKLVFNRCGYDYTIYYATSVFRTPRNVEVYISLGGNICRLSVSSYGIMVRT